MHKLKNVSILVLIGLFVSLSGVLIAHQVHVTHVQSQINTIQDKRSDIQGQDVAIMTYIVNGLNNLHKYNKNTMSTQNNDYANAKTPNAKDNVYASTLKVTDSTINKAQMKHPNDIIKNGIFNEISQHVKNTKTIQDYTAQINKLEEKKNSVF